MTDFEDKSDREVQQSIIEETYDDRRYFGEVKVNWDAYEEHSRREGDDIAHAVVSIEMLEGFVEMLKGARGGDAFELTVSRNNLIVAKPADDPTSTREFVLCQRKPQ